MKSFFGGIGVGFLVGICVAIWIYPPKSQPPIPINLKLCFAYYKWVEEAKQETTDMERYCSIVRQFYNVK